ncbi:MAG: Tetratricopeptide repeat protein [Nitrospira sp.]|nr:MAG: Tetratricopeptide repeat protein [Nitrospira sp.]
MRMSSRCLSASILGLGLFLLAGLSGVQSASAQLGKPEGLYYKSWAIVIGVEHYLLAPPIPGAIQDAKTVAQAFRQMGFDEVVEVYDQDASFRRLQQLLSNMLPRKVGRMDRLVLFYVGHAGVTQDADGKDLGYLVPSDAQVNNVAKSITFDELKEVTRRLAAKHTLLILDTAVRGWEVTAPQQLSLEGRLSPENDTERRAMQVITAGDKGEVSQRAGDASLFVKTLLAGLQGAADVNKDGWLMASELGAYLEKDVSKTTGGQQHPISARLDGDGDTVLVEGRKAAFVLGAGPQTPAERQQAARAQYDQAFVLLQEGTRVEEALERLNRSIELNPEFGDAYVLKSYIRLELLPNLDEALATGRLAATHAATNPDSHYTLGLIYEKRGSFPEAEQAFLQALKVNAGYQDVYFSLGTLYADRLKDQAKSVEAFRRYVELGGTDSRAREAVKQADAQPKP